MTLWYEFYEHEEISVPSFSMKRILFPLLQRGNKGKEVFENLRGVLEEIWNHTCVIRKSPLAPLFQRGEFLESPP